MNIKFIAFCLILSFPLTAQQPAQQSQPTLMQKLKKEWKKVTALTVAAVGTISAAVYLGVRQQRYNAMTPLERADLLPSSSIPFEKEPVHKTRQEIKTSRELLKEKVNELATQGITFSEDLNVLLGQAAKYGYPELVQLAIDAGARINYDLSMDQITPLWEATNGYIRAAQNKKNDYLKIVTLLLENNGWIYPYYAGIWQQDENVLVPLFTKYGYRGNYKMIRRKQDSKIVVEKYWPQTR